jgi:DMSO/TMAO reductase YedYZ heme-binding membrane subunit
VPTTSGRSRGRRGVRSGAAAGPAGDHVPTIMVTLSTASIVVVFMLVMTKAGRDIDAATQRFMLYYAGVFALVGLTASVGAGLLATDRIFMTPGHRVMAQAVHRAVSFAALAFLVIHIVTEILAQRVHVIDAFIPFLSPYRTFYIGLGTIASDLILLVVVTSILRKRYAARGRAWRWRAIHYASYAAFVLGVLHGLLGGREAKPYVDWSYGFAIAATALALVVRFLALSLRPDRSLSAPPGAGESPGLGSSSLRAAALRMAQARPGGTAQVPRPWAVPPTARDRFAVSGPFPALDAPAVYAAAASYEAHRDPAFVPLGAPPFVNGRAAGPGIDPYAAADLPPSARAGPGSPAGPARQPRYEPGYDGPPRFEGAPRKHVPQDDVSSYPYGPPRRRADRNPGPLPRPGTGPAAHPGPGPLPRADRAARRSRGADSADQGYRDVPGGDQWR